jgi:hypothetical protein
MKNVRMISLAAGLVMCQTLANTGLAASRGPIIRQRTLEAQSAPSHVEVLDMLKCVESVALDRLQYPYQDGVVIVMLYRDGDMHSAHWKGVEEIAANVVVRSQRHR